MRSKVISSFFLLFGSLLISACARTGPSMPLDGYLSPQQSKPANNTGSTGSDCGIDMNSLGFDEDIQPIFEARCKLCHTNGSQNWMDYQVVQSKLAKFEDRLFVKKDMPPRGFSVSAEELDTIRRWINTGANKSKQHLGSCRDLETSPEPPPAPSEPSNPESEQVYYTTHMIPLIEKHCSMCHSGGPLNWMEYSQLKAVADNGKLYDRVLIKKDMPMYGFPSLSEQELKIFQLWIEQGAKEKP